MNKRFLYLVKTVGMGSHYVVAANPSDAHRLMLAEWDRLDYGYPSSRQLKSIDLLAEHNEYPQGCSRLWIAEGDHNE